MMGTMSELPLIGLLDDRSLDGAVDVRCGLGPAMCAELVAADDFEGAMAAVRGLCDAWGGATHRVYPMTAGSDQLPTEFDEDTVFGVPTSVGGSAVLDISFQRDSRRDVHIYDENGVGTSLFAALLDSEAFDGVSVGVVDVDLDDPWAVAYYGVLGDLQREALPPHLLQRLRLRPDVGWGDVIDIRVEKPSPPGGADLLRRLREPNVMVPSRFSCSLLSLRLAPRDSGTFGGSIGLFPNPWAERALVGPNIVVVYEPGSVSDLALLWNLRAAHGLPSGFPLAVPASVDVAAVLRSWLDEYAYTPFGAGGQREPRLVSTSVALPALAEIAEEAPGYIAGEWRDFRAVGRRPSRLGLRLAEFKDG